MLSRTLIYEWKRKGARYMCYRRPVCRHLLSQRFHLFEYLRGIGQALAVNTLEPDHTLFVDDKHRAPTGPPLLVVDAVQLRDQALGMKIGQYGVWDVSESGAEGSLHCGAVYADAQDLGIFLLEPTILQPEPGDLVRSAACEGHDVKGKYDVLLSTVLA